MGWSSKKKFHQNVPWNISGKCFLNKIFPPCTQWAPEVRKAKNCQIRSNQVKTYSVPAQPNGENFFFNFTPRDLRTSGAIEITNKINIPQFYQLTNFHSTNNPCLKALVDSSFMSEVMLITHSVFCFGKS